MSADALVQARGLRFAYGRGEHVIDAVDLTLHAGLTLVLGPNGCGKSTLLRLLAGVERAAEGTIEIAGHDLWRDEIAARMPLVYVPDPPDLSPLATIGEAVRLAGRVRGASDDAIEQALERAGMVALARRSSRELSLGQRRRALLAAAWTHPSPRLLLLDEPLEAMDRAMRVAVLAWIDAALLRQAAVVVVTHDLDPFTARAGRAISLRRGRLVDSGRLPDDLVARGERLGSLALGAAE